MTTPKPEFDFLSISDFLVILIKRRVLFLSVWVLVIILAAGYALLSDKVYKVSGTIYVGKFNEELLEDGEFVAQKLKDYSFISRALKTAQVKIKIPVSRLQKSIDTELVNEIKKTKDVGLVKLTVYYKGDQKAVDIFKALTDQLIREHAELLEESREVMKGFQDHLVSGQEAAEKSISEDEALLRAQNVSPDKSTVPSMLLLGHTMGEKRWYRTSLAKDLNISRIQALVSTKSFNSRLASEPELPDSHDQPKLSLTLILGFIAGGILAILAVMGWQLLVEDVIPKLRRK